MDTDKLFEQAADAARQAFESHWIEFDSPKIGRDQQRAECGELVKSSTFSATPTCAACKKRKEELDDPQYWEF